MLVEDLKPLVAAELGTLRSRDHTAMMGASLGGLITAYAGGTRADVFGRIGILSPSTWWAHNVFDATLAASSAARGRWASTSTAATRAWTPLGVVADSQRQS